MSDEHFHSPYAAPKDPALPPSDMELTKGRVALVHGSGNFESQIWAPDLVAMSGML